MDQGASAGASSAGGGTHSFAQVWALPLGQQYGLASCGLAMGAMDAARTLQVPNTITQEKEQDEEVPMENNCTSSSSSVW